MDKAIPIQSESGAHFGFLLLAGNEGDHGECVRFGAKESGEHRWKKVGDAVSIDLTTGDVAVMDLSARTLIFNSEVRFKIA
jgi:hypothetical protein